jgi:DNA-binding transcriptional MerR regulator
LSLTLRQGASSSREGILRTYRTQEFAELAGVTVRALHHYDRMGLLKPRRTEAGYRVYGDRDLERLEQIVALKFLGIPLKEIKDLLERNGLELTEALRRQRYVLEQKRALLDAAVCAIRAGGSVAALRPPARGSGPQKNHRGDRNAREHGLDVEIPER